MLHACRSGKIDVRIVEGVADDADMEARRYGVVEARCGVEDVGASRYRGIEARYRCSDVEAWRSGVVLQVCQRVNV